MGDLPPGPKMRSICIIGAGPAGLVAAKTFLQTGRCQVTIYEKAARLGGIWALDEDSTDGFLSPYTPTNLSRFTVGFSDLSWRSVPLGGGKNGGSGGNVPMFPKAWQVGQYLEAYRRKYIPGNVIKYEQEVEAVSRGKLLQVGAQECWMVTTRGRDSLPRSEYFDHLVIATGFFAKPRPLEYSVKVVKVGGDRGWIKMLHSSQFRSLADLLPTQGDLAGKKILMIGGGNSAGEAAANIASHLSNAQWSPDTAEREPMKDCRIVHVTPRPFYALPPYTATDEDSASFMPLDFNFYNLARRPPGPITGSAGRVPKAAREMLHAALRKSIGGDQSDLGAAALVASEDTEQGTVQVALAESYAEFVRAGLIEVLAGRVASITSESERVSASVRKDENLSEIKIADIGAVVYATGYSPTTALDMLGDQKKKDLAFDEMSLRLPVILEQWQTTSQKEPNLGFIGFYEGPYWGVMEMQARLIAERWLNSTSIPSRPFEEASNLLDLRSAMQKKSLDVPQYWFGDYGGYMEELASLLRLQRNDGDFQPRSGPVSPARYLAPEDHLTEAQNTVQDLYQTWQACATTGRYTARAVFRALQGNWTIDRRIKSLSGAYPSGTLIGTASFHPRFPSTMDFDLEYLYLESSSFTPPNSSTVMNASRQRRYVYRYSEAADQLSIWVVNPASDLEVDHLSHNLAFVPPNEAKAAGCCVAKANHLCEKDVYETEYRLEMKGIAMGKFEVEHRVKGPGKDYVSVTEYRRQMQEGQ